MLSEVIELSSRLRRPDFYRSGRSRNKSHKRYPGGVLQLPVIVDFWIFSVYTRKASHVSGDKF